MKLKYSILAMAAFITAMLLSPVPDAQASSPEAASKYIESLGDDALKAISNQSLGKKQKKAKLEDLFADNVDFKWVGRFVMGRYWRKATDAQKERYVTEYKKFLLMHYASRFANIPAVPSK
jgi:phospholipid transport system substrate-binding protein